MYVYGWEKLKRKEKVLIIVRVRRGKRREKGGGGGGGGGGSEGEYLCDPTALGKVRRKAPIWHPSI